MKKLLNTVRISSSDDVNEALGKIESLLLMHGIELMIDPDTDPGDSSFMDVYVKKIKK